MSEEKNRPGRAYLEALQEEEEQASLGARQEARTHTLEGALQEDGKQAPLETLFERLETVVGCLEGGEATLEESFRLYQEGMALLRKCNETIDAVEKKVLILDEEGETHEF